jgi:hypothetical protein
MCVRDARLRHAIVALVRQLAPPAEPVFDSSKILGIGSDLRASGAFPFRDCRSPSVAK